MFDLISEKMVPHILPHLKGTPQPTHSLTNHQNFTEELCTDLQIQIDSLVKKGYPRWGIILGANIGFEKTHEQDFELIRNLDLIKKKILQNSTASGVFQQTFC